MTDNSGESALSRWSRRKLEAKQELASVDPAPEPEQVENPDQAAMQEAEAPPLTDADMPDIDTLDENSDFSPFMSAGVSDELRNLALRKLFRAPVFNIRDGLDEYDEDYTTFEKLGDIVTADMKHQAEMQEQKLREALAAENETVDADDIEAAELVEDDEEAVGEIENDVEADVSEIAGAGKLQETVGESKG